MRNFLLSLAILITQSCTGPAAADDGMTHQAAHFGMSYVITTFTYGVLKSIPGSEEADHFGLVFIPIVTSLAVGATYKFLSTPGKIAPKDFERAMLWNCLGTGAAIFTIEIFHF